MFYFFINLLFSKLVLFSLKGTLFRSWTFCTVTHVLWWFRSNELTVIVCCFLLCLGRLLRHVNFEQIMSPIQFFCKYFVYKCPSVEGRPLSIPWSNCRVLISIWCWIQRQLNVIWILCQVLVINLLIDLDHCF